MTAEIEGFIRDAAQKRGINPDVAVRAFKTEGGVDEYAKLGDFSGPPWYSGKSWWPPQLHYGGEGYEQFGRTAGMGNSFTKLTGWQPGDPCAWRDAVRYALNRVKLGGWGPWYGPATIGITGFVGVNRDAPWDANSETWDYEGGDPSMATPTYNPDVPLLIQDKSWNCWPTSARMALEAWGRHPTEGWIESQSIADGIESREQGLLDGSGSAGAAWLTRQYGDPGEGTPTIKAASAASVSFDDVRSVAGSTAVMLGGHRWGPGGHWTFVRRYNPATDQLELGNPAGTYQGIGQTMSRQQFDQVSPCSMILVTADGAAPAVPQPSQPDDPRDARIAELQTALAAEREKTAGLISTLGYLTGDVAEAIQAAVNTLRAHDPAA